MNSFVSTTFPLKLNLTTSQRRATTCVTAPPAPPQTAQRAKWQCVPECGACCNVGGYDADVLDEILRDQSDVDRYMAMLGEDGWCRNYDKQSRTCTTYEDRPWFCQVKKHTLGKVFEFDDFDKFAIECCFYHIDEIHGPQSDEMKRFESAVGVRWVSSIDGPEDDIENESNADTAQNQPDGSSDEDDNNQDIVWSDEMTDCDKEACEVPLFDVPESEKL